MRIMAFMFLLMFSAVPVLSGETAWQEIAPDANLRLISSDETSSDGKLMVALELQMPDEMKTYWYIPGETGIPLQLDFSGSRGVANQTTHWPFPLREQKDGYLDHVYYGNLVIPIELEIDQQAPFVNLSLIMGVCSDICVPVQVEFTHQVDLTSDDIAASLRIAQAMAETPISWDGAADAISAISYDSQAQQFLFDVIDERIDVQSIIVSSLNGANLFSAPQATGFGQTLAFHGLNPDLSMQLLGEPLTLTFLTLSGPYEVVRTVSP